jgi:hypothetical protein
VRVALPAYVERWPYRVRAFSGRGVSALCLLLRGDQQALQRHYDRTFNEPTNRRVHLRADNAYVLLTLSTTQRLFGQDHAYPDIGAETELALMTFATDAATDRLVLTVPYLFVDNPLALVQGREVFGYPKELGGFSPPVLAPDHDPARASSVRLVVRAVEAFGPDARFRPLPLLVLTRAEAAEPALVRAMADLGAALARPPDDARALGGFLHDRLEDAALVRRGLELLATRTVTVLSLKQFHDVSTSELACYQSVVASELRLTALGGFRHLDSHFDVTLNELASHPIGRDLGLEETTHSALSFAMEYDFDVTARTLWRANDA